jgi:hypothetical protein
MCPVRESNVEAMIRQMVQLLVCPDDLAQRHQADWLVIPLNILFTLPTSEDTFCMLLRHSSLSESARAFLI